MNRNNLLIKYIRRRVFSQKSLSVVGMSSSTSYHRTAASNYYGRQPSIRPYTTTTDTSQKPNTSNGNSSSTSSSTSSSVSSDEVSKFSSMAKTWWDPDQNPLISMNPKRMQFIIQTLRQNHRLLHMDGTTRNHKPLTGLKALDVGCGGGLLSESLARLGAQVTAIDPSEQVANAAYEHSKLDPSTSNGIEYKGGTSVEDLDYQLNTMEKCSNESLFDVVCILEVIEHATDPMSLVQSATSLLKKPTIDNPSGGGMLFVSTINRTVKSYGIAILGGEYVTRKLPIGTHTWDQFKSPEEISSLVGTFGLKEVDVNGMLLKPPFFDLSWELSKTDFDVNWIGAYSYSNDV